MSEHQPRTCKARKGMVLVYEYTTTSMGVSSGARSWTSYRLGVVAAASREGRLRAIKPAHDARTTGYSTEYDDRRNNHGYQPVKAWRLVPELPIEAIPADMLALAHSWGSWDEAKAALRPLIVGTVAS